MSQTEAAGSEGKSMNAKMHAKIYNSSLCPSLASSPWRGKDKEYLLSAKSHPPKPAALQLQVRSKVERGEDLGKAEQEDGRADQTKLTHQN